MMNLSSSVKYQWYQYKRPLRIFYSILVLSLLAIVAINMSQNELGMRVHGIEICSCIFLLILVMSNFRTSFHFSLVNGVSRKTMFKSHMMIMFIIAAIMASVDTFISTVYSQFVSYGPVFLLIYGERYDMTAPMDAVVSISGQMILEQFVWLFCLYIFIQAIGYSIRLLYYKISRKWSLIITFAVITTILYIFPLIDNLTNQQFFKSLTDLVKFLLGLSETINPFVSVVTFIIGFFVLLMINFQLVSKIIIKKS